MLFPALFRALRRSPRGAVRAPRPGFRPRLEALEDRVVPSFVPSGSPIDVTTAGAGGQQLHSSRTVAVEASGTYRVVWEDNGIYTRLFSAGGTPLGNPVLATGTTAADTAATLAVDAAGDTVLAWTHQNANGGTQIYAQSFSAAGAPGVVAHLAGTKSSAPTVATYNASYYLVAYTDESAATPAVQVATVDTAHGREDFTYTVANASQPSLAMNSSGNAVLAFAREASAGFIVHLGVYDYVLAQQLTWKAAPQGATVQVASQKHVLAEQQLVEPSVAIDAAGDFVVAYTFVRGSQSIAQPPFSPLIDNQTEVHAVLFNAQGNVQATNTVWSSTSPTANGYAPSVAVDAAGDYVVAYLQGGNDGAWDLNDGYPSVEAVSYSNKGVQLQAAIHSSSYPSAPYYDSVPSAALSPSDQLVEVWQNYGTKNQGDLPSTGVFTQTFTYAPFSYQLVNGSNGSQVTVQGGMPSSIQIDVTKDPAYNGPVTIAFPTLPPGVTYTVKAGVPGPSEYTVAFQTADNVPNSYNFPATLQLKGSTATLTRTINFFVSTSDISGWTGSANDATLYKGFTAAIDGAGFVPGSTVQFGSPKVTATPSAIDSAGHWLTVTVPMNAVNGPITIVRPGGSPIVSSSSAQYSEGKITSLSTTDGYAPGYSAQYLTLGSVVQISGAGFRPGAKVIFGNPGTTPLSQLEATPGIVASANFIDPSGNWLTVNVPQYALTGPVEVVEPDGTLLTSAQQFTVHDYRNTFAFSFDNFNTILNWGVLKSEYGGDQVDITIPTFPGLPNIDTGIPNPVVFAVWEAWQSSLSDECFGMCLTSLLMANNPSLIDAANGLPAGKAPTVYNLRTNTTSDPLAYLISQNDLAQMSTQMAGYFAGWEGAAAAGQITAAGLKATLTSDLASGTHPIVYLKSASHSVVAYGVEAGTPGQGDFYIDVYDPNRPFNLDGSEATNLLDHAQVEMGERIHVTANGQWSFTGAGGTNYGGGFGSLVVIPPSVVSGGLTMPLSMWGGL